jgi:hypothetical protein
MYTIYWYSITLDTCCDMLHNNSITIEEPKYWLACMERL